MSENYLAIDVVKQHFAEATRTVGQFAEAEYAEWMQYELSGGEYTPPLESPLEALFFLWWGVIAGRESPWGRRFNLEPQQEVEAYGERYRLDFVVGLEADTAWQWHQEDLSWPLLAVEVDGHSYHEKTPEQVARRNQRDRALQQCGWTVFHFSWTEMTTRPLECVGEALGVARQSYNRVLADAWRAKQVADGAATKETGAQTSQES